ncbi:MAG: MBL fold metallo-hydrolase RNA specificity domain-containing protein [bacterium]
MFEYNHGIKINGTSLWLDAHKSVDFCCVTHAHMDHAKKHKRILATAETLRFLTRRVGKTQATALEFRQPYEFGACAVTLLPAGHILGSAQVLVERDGLRLLYSGDFNLEASATAEAIEIPESDILIMECTFGKPQYRFPQRQVVETQLRDFVTEAFNEGAVPVVVGYALGKAQEAMKILGDAGHHLSVHGSIAALAKIYEQFGVDFGGWEKYNKDHLEGKVLIIPPNAVRTRMVKRLQAKKSVFLSGWAINRGTQYRYGVDAALPLSDHADFDGLLEYARRVHPRKIYTTHGPDEFAHHLRAAGFDAEPLKKPAQLALF